MGLFYVSNSQTAFCHCSSSDTNYTTASQLIKNVVQGYACDKNSAFIPESVWNQLPN